MVVYGVGEKWLSKVREARVFVTVEKNRKNQIIEIKKGEEHEERTQIDKLLIFLVVGLNQWLQLKILNPW